MHRRFNSLDSMGVVPLQRPLPIHTMYAALFMLVLLSSQAQINAGQTQKADTPVSAGEALLQSAKPSEAREAFEAVLKSNPGDLEARKGEVVASERLALDARQAGHADEALQDLLRAENFAPEEPRLLYDLGILEDEMQLYRDADQTLSTLEQLQPGDPQVMYAVARVKLDLGQLASAEEKMQAYLKLQPNDASAHYGLGRVYQLGLHFDKARAEFQRSIALQAVQTEAYYQLGDIALGQEEFDEAITYFSKTLARNSKHGGALAGTGQAYFKQKQYTRAEAFLERAVAAAPDYQAGHYYLGLTLARLGRKEDSRRELAQATRLAEEQARKDRGLYLNSEPANP
jgi:tetratricopeptide (TPR) repeat protein